MNDCCDWNAVCLNSEDIIHNGISNMYISYCPECNSINEFKDGVLKKVDAQTYALYKNKYADKIENALDLARKS